MCLLNGGAHLLDHLVKFGATTCCETLGMCFLKEPELLKGDNRVPAGDFKIELKSTSEWNSYWEIQEATHNLLELLKAEHIRLLRMRPTQKRSKVDQCSWKDALLVFE